MDPSTAPYIFISYASVDRARVREIATVIEQLGVAVWFDQEAIDGGLSYGPEIVAGIQGCAAVALMCSAAAVNSRNVRQELHLAWKYERPYLPLLLEPVIFPRDIEYWLEGAQWIEVLAHAEEEWAPRVARAFGRLGIPLAHTPVADEHEAGESPHVVPLPSRRNAGNLPAPLTRLIGRVGDLVAVGQLLDNHRLVTLVGPGGIGKTRLAIEVGRDRLGRYSDGVWLIELAPLRDPELIPATIASVLGVSDQPGQAPIDAVVEHLRQREMLLLLDNCEHLAVACARLAETLLRACPALVTLATSRSALRTGGEAIYQVATLSVPAASTPVNAVTLVRSEAAQLFLDRAMPAGTGVLSDVNASAIAQICRQLDGIPLALELAAARVKVLTVEQIATRLANRFRLLTSGSRTAVPRQQTLKALLDWSYDLLTEPQRILFGRLAVFAGDWTLDAAEAVGAGDGIEAEDVLDLLAELVDQSLIVADEAGSEMRYRQLETIHAYGLERLSERGELAQLRARHHDYFHAVAEEAQPHLTGPRQREWLDRLETEHDNLRAALNWSIEAGNGEQSVRFAASLWRFWYLHGHVTEGQRWLEAALAGPASTPMTRARALLGVGGLAMIQGQLERATAAYTEGLALYQAADARQQVAGTLLNLGNIAGIQGEFERAFERFEESLAVFQALDYEPGMAVSLLNLGNVAKEQHDFRQAVRRYEASLALYRSLEDAAGSIGVLQGLGDVFLERGDEAQALARYRESVALGRGLGDTVSIAAGLERVAATLAAQRHALAAARLWGAAAELRHTLGVPANPDDQARNGRWQAVARAAVDATTWDTAWLAGQAMTLEQALDAALDSDIAR